MFMPFLNAADPWKPPDEFQTGDLCMVIDQSQLRGREVVILGPAEHVAFQGSMFWAYPIEIQGFEESVGTFFCKPHVLKKLPPRDLKLESWDACPFNPHKKPNARATRKTS